MCLGSWSGWIAHRCVEVMVTSEGQGGMKNQNLVDEAQDSFYEPALSVLPLLILRDFINTLPIRA